MKYFAYGSNMSYRRLAARVPSAEFITVARLNGHSLAFRKRSRKDSSAKCDIAATRNSRDTVWGVVFDIDASEKPALDRVEGLGFGYELKHVEVAGSDGGTVTAFTYYATDIDATLKPYSWYREHVIRGAREHGLPDDYVALIEDVLSMRDPDSDRHDRELSIYD